MTYVDPSRPTPPEVEAVAEIRKAEARSNATAWWVAGLVAVVAIGAVAFMVTSSTTPDQASAAAEQARAEGVVQGLNQGMQQGAAQAQLNSAAAQSAAAQSAQLQSAQLAAQTEADRAAAARARAEAAAADAQARSATDTANDASASVNEPAPPQ